MFVYDFQEFEEVLYWIREEQSCEATLTLQPDLHLT